MPGYKWTVHKAEEPEKFIEATGVKTAGFNRTSTLSVVRRQTDKFGEKGTEYTVKSSGYGAKASWLATNKDKTLARALRGLQNIYEHMASQYNSHAEALESARKSDQPQS